MKILQINANYGFSSTGIIMKDIGDAIVSSGHEAYFAYQRTNSVVKSGYRIGNIIDWKLHAMLCRLLGSQGFYSQIPTRNLIRYIDGLKPDVVHLHNLHSNYINIGMLFKYLAEQNIPTVITMHDCWYFTGKCFHYIDCNCDRFQEDCGNCPKRKSPPISVFFDRSQKNLKRKIKALTSVEKLFLVGCSDWICTETKKSRLSKCNILRIYNGVDTSIFTLRDDRAIRKKYGVEDKRIIMGMANKWLQETNYTLLKMVIDNLTDNDLLMIVGCDEEQKNRLSKYGSCVLAIGFISDRKELAQLYSMADVFVNPTHADTLPTVNMESICSGTPVVTFDVGGSPELINSASGVVVKEGDYEAMLEAVNKICYRINEIDCADIGQKRFDKNQCYDEYINLYEKICSSN